MPFSETKVYFDGSHYIAIPHTTRSGLKRRKPEEEQIPIVEELEIRDNSKLNLNANENISEDKIVSNLNLQTENISDADLENKQEPQLKIKRIVTRKEIFNELYSKYIDTKKTERKKIIVNEMQKYFKTKEQCENFVHLNFDRKERNLISRRVRMCRKANLANFNYFCTFTYDDNKLTEETFKKKLQGCFKMMCHRKKWKYMGVWERSPKTSRLHFHGLFNIPAGAMPGEIIEIKDYSTQLGKMQKTFQSSYFNSKFGRSDFKEIDEQERRLGNALAYLMKYIEKTGEKIVYSKGLPQYFISDILDEDIICTIGQEDKKLLLFDDFTCIDEGEVIGKVNSNTIEQMRKSN